MKKIFISFFTLIMIFGLVSCSFISTNSNSNKKTEEQTKVEEEKTVDSEKTPVTEEPKDETINPTNPSEKTPIPTYDDTSGKDYYDEVNTKDYYDELFDINNKVVVKVNITESEIKKIESDYQKYGSECNIYRMADSVEIIITDSKTNVVCDLSIEEVGIRMKGNTTRHSFYENGITSLIHFKLDFQETFDDSSIYSYNELKSWNDDVSRENRKNRTFFSLRGLELKYNAEGDLTYTRDIYSSKMYRSNGIYAQAMSLGVLDFNIDNNSNKSGTLGVYKIYEPVDRVFVKRYFPADNNDGDLYKASWGSAKGMPSLNSSSSSCYGVDESAPGVQKTISYDLKTNKKKSTHAALINLLTWINGSTKDLNKTLKDYIDEEYFVTWLAIMYISGDWDNFMYDSNNYYMYFDETGLCYFIPYDMDRTYGIQAKNHNMSDIKPLDTWNLQGSGNRSKLLKKTIDISNSSLREKYLAKIKELSKDLLNYNEFNRYYECVERHYFKDVIPTMTTLQYEYELKTSNPFFHLIIGNGTYICDKDSNDFNNAFDSYCSKKQSVINANC